jgi:phosphatidylethanolamine-binding protein
MIDQDVPRNGSKVTLLHWLQPNLVATPEALSVINIMDGASTAIGAEYIPPTPPANSGPHRYTFLLFEQPSMWVIPAEFATINPPADTSARIGFDISEFVAASGLSAPVAANYLQVLNGTSAESSSAATETYVAPTVMLSGSVTSAATVSASSTGSAGASVTSAGGSATSAMASATASATDGAVAIRGNTKELLIGLAMGVAGAGLWML